nr:unnamed protein product [Digitaria exilis]
MEALQDPAEVVTVGLGVEGSVEALEEGIDGVDPTSGKVAHDAEDEDADHKRVGLVAAAPDIDEAERVGRGVGPALGAQQAAETVAPEEGDDAAEANPRQCRTVAAETPRRLRHRNFSQAASIRWGNED